MEGARFIRSRRRYGASGRTTTDERVERLDPTTFKPDDYDSGDPRLLEYEVEVLERLILAHRRCRSEDR